MLELFFRLRQEHRARFLRRQARNALQLFLLLVAKLIDGRARAVDLRFLAQEDFFLLLQGIELAVEILFLLHNAAFLSLQLTAPILCIAIKLLAEPMNILLRLKQSLFLLGLALGLRLGNDPPRLIFGRADLRLRSSLAQQITAAHASDQRENDRQNYLNDN